MNINIGTKLLHSSSLVRFALLQLPKRTTCKIAVEVDSELVNKLQNNELKPRRHPGIIKSQFYELPKQISSSLIRIIGDHPIKSLLRDAKILDRHIRGRHPPLEHNELLAKVQIINEEVEKMFPSEQFETLTEEEKSKWSQRREQVMRRKLKSRAYAWKPITYTSYEALVYAIGRAAQEYAILRRILSEIETRDQNFKPRSYFDFGSGVGTGMWAVSNIWQNSIFEYYNVDSSREMNDLSELILREGNENQQLTLKNVYHRQFLPGMDTQYDLVVSAYSLFEQPSAQSRKETLLNLWRKCLSYMIIVEEGTRCGSELVVEARDFILGLEEDDLKGHVFAPCPHDSPCPRFVNFEDRTPCNFEISFAPLKIGNVKADRHTARYSYVVLKKGLNKCTSQKWPRIVRSTLIRPGHIICRLCTSEAKLQEVIFTKSKHGKSAYACAKASRWGDRLPITLGDRLNIETKTSKWIHRNKSDGQIDNIGSEPHDIDETRFN